MIDRAAAEEIARAELAKMLPPTEADEIILIDDATVERPWGWVFFYDTRRYVETKDPDARLLGNAPFVVEGGDGSVHFLSTAGPPQNYIHQYEQQRPPDA